MSLLTNQSEVNANKALWAPASGGGGGGGGSGGNLVVSSISFNGQIAAPIEEDIQFPGGYTGTVLADQFQIKSGTNDNLVFFDAENINISITDNTNQVKIGLDASGALTLLSIPSGPPPSIKMLSPTFVSSLTVSSINGQQPGGAITIPANLSVSTLTAANTVAATSSITATTFSAANGGFLAPQTNAQSFTGLLIGNPTAEDAYAQILYQWGGVTSQDVEMRFVGHNNSAQTGLSIQTSAVSSQTIVAGTNGGYINLQGVNNAAVSSINNLQPAGTLAGAQDYPAVQSGYVPNCPYASTILFPKPYLTDKISVIVTPGNKGVPNGVEPSCALGSAFGTNGVSSIGFVTDYRFNGVGQAQDIFWMAFPWTN